MYNSYDSQDSYAFIIMGQVLEPGAQFEGTMLRRDRKGQARLVSDITYIIWRWVGGIINIYIYIYVIYVYIPLCACVYTHRVRPRACLGAPRVCRV